MTNFHELLGRVNGIAIIDILGTLILMEVTVRHINRDGKYRIGLLRWFALFFFGYLALFTHLLLGIDTPLTATLIK